MGADTFMNRSNGKTAQAAFKAAVEQARCDHGHSGYSGTIAEKHGFVTILCPKGTDPVEFANDLIKKCDSRIDDKWGPAGCIEVKKGEYLFFGVASS